ncbi:L-2-amino-thiazoline-4-carboxylic acid hydrolase [Chloroflexota bacterium]
MDTIDTQTNYYLDRKEKYWKQLERLFRSSNKILPEYMQTATVENINEETRIEFEILLSQLPYIGGEKNIFTFTFVSGAAALAYIRILEKHSLPVDTIGELLNKVYADVFASLPRFVKWYFRWLEFSPGHKKKLRAFAEESRLYKYPDNWVMDFIEGEGEKYDFACHYTECAVLKFFRKMEAEEYMPYICVMDLTSSKALRTGLFRTTTLFYGGDCCDFQFKKNRPSMPGIPIEDLPEYKNRKL